jgi:hypothetical protein
MFGVIVLTQKNKEIYIVKTAFQTTLALAQKNATIDSNKKFGYKMLCKLTNCYIKFCQATYLAASKNSDIKCNVKSCISLLFFQGFLFSVWVSRIFKGIANFYLYFSINSW